MREHHFILVLFGIAMEMLSSPAIRSQTFTQVYPGYRIHDFFALGRWNGDTVFVAGNNSGFMRSTNAGVTWNNVFEGNDGYDFVRMGMNASGVYLLPAATMSTMTQFADTAGMFILRYDPWTSDTERIALPLPTHEDPDRRSLYCDLSVTSRCIHVLQSVRPRTVDPWSTKRTLTLLSQRNEDVAWVEHVLPDSIGSDRPWIFFRDEMRGFLISGPYRGGPSVYVTIDGGTSWKLLSELHSTQSMDPAAQWVDDTTFVMAVDKWTLKKTTDMGMTWDSMMVPTPEISTAYFLSNGRGIVAGKRQDICRTSNYGRNWDVIHPQLFLSNQDTGPLHSLVLDDASFICVGSRGYIYRTSDAGMTWDTPNFTSRYYASILFTSDNEGLGVCYSDIETIDRRYCTTSDGGASWSGAFSRDAIPYSSWVVPVSLGQVWAVQAYPNFSDTLIYLSTDGGATWDGVCRSSVLHDTLRFFENQWNSDLYSGLDSFMVFSDHGILRTLDRGRTWELKTQIRTLLPASLDPLSTYIGIFCGDPRRQWFVTNDRILQSTDFGATWSNVHSISPSSGEGIIGAHAVSATELCTGIADAYMRPSFLFTSDAGKSWERYENSRVQDPIDNRFFGTLFSGGMGYAWVGGNSTYQKEHILLKTTDFWRTAIPVFVGHQTTVYGLSHYFRSSTIGWIGIGYSLYRTTNGGIDWVRSVPTEPLNVQLHPVYPNPVTSGTGLDILFSIIGERPIQVELDVFNSVGCRIFKKYSSAFSPGHHAIHWETRGASSGVYFVRLGWGFGSSVEKITIR